MSNSQIQGSMNAETSAVQRLVPCELPLKFLCADRKSLFLLSLRSENKIYWRIPIQLQGNVGDVKNKIQNLYAKTFSQPRASRQWIPKHQQLFSLAHFV
jgi:hypothetical protein